MAAVLPTRKAKDLVNELQQISQKGNLTPAHAAKIRGRVGFSQSLLFGRFGRALSYAFTARQYSKLSCRFRPLNDELKEAIDWRIGALSGPTPRKILFNLPRPTLVYVDAAGCGHAGAAAFYDTSSRISHTHLPGWLTEIGEIYDFEMTGAILGLALANVVAPGRPIVIYIDNTAAASTIVRGNCKTAIGRAPTSVFWLIAAQFASPVWAEQVVSKLNVSDAPSRTCKRIKGAPPLKSPNYGTPNQFQAIFTSRDTLSKHQFKPCSDIGSFAEGWLFPELNAETE